MATNDRTTATGQTTAAPPPAQPSRALWGDRGVTTKVLSAVAVAGVVTAAVGVLGLQALSSSAAEGTALYRDNLLGVAAASDMDGYLADMRVNIRDAILSTGPTDAQDNIDEMSGIQKQFDAAVAAYSAGGLEPEKQVVLEKISGTMDEYTTFRKQVLAPLAVAGDVQGWIGANDAQGMPLIDLLTTDIQQLRDAEASEAEATARAITSTYQSERTVSIVLMLVGIAVAVGVGVLVATGIARAARKVQSVVEGLAEGDLTRSSGLATRDELGKMGQALDSAMTNLRSVLSGVAASADAVAASSEELSASSAQISASAEETSAQSGVVSAAAEEVSRNVATVAAGAEQMGASIREIS
ncbi:MAG TPA: methyl-accepting chemotaxis protein, partial [Modestobacter sp.]|nr:methyl-accepting chemotaxis protein [Modestobacter sp.]